MPISMKGFEKQMSKIAQKLLKTILLTALLMYTCLTVFKQEAAFHKYENEIEKYERMIEEENLKNEQLMYTRTQISSKEYVEEIAREKLGLVMPNEIVFVDANL